ncbi:unnamed protein product [Darwinula stevensoni]|uniref:Large ribosomal subunit protein eL28 n=1 Tax=Darwinula stevensoni TaxID=69355 RepID=A0A7R9A5K3_9CRUS|nr:unnamed protein product [Darwinula stevensoni]CAG0895720.1 unnamed protein product [Darwinula stevensoni]
MTDFLQWEIIKNHHAYLVKRPNVRPLSKELFNVRNIHGMKANGLIHRRAISIQPANDNKGVIVTKKNPKRLRQPASQNYSVVMKAGPRRLLWKLARMFKYQNYRRDLKKATLRRASAILKSQRTKIAKKRTVKRGMSSKKKLKM